ncbi:hypothetical protein DUNSADRAFT_8113 [Dunaliella salina]|uniref:Encoded protein n=1 Tax=Dunaliella salina TaxID=3046 RepID=A0ABQ7GK16_DUNSA|nr:hypothetical protein DUNSADRAFT_8113 [Dunaliella salina]|eukprot:KAF5834964.1 hypothetical protein DUNSADRAFT_8113 [Dunaliella salina]
MPVAVCSSIKTFICPTITAAYHSPHTIALRPNADLHHFSFLGSSFMQKRDRCATFFQSGLGYHGSWSIGIIIN